MLANAKVTIDCTPKSLAVGESFTCSSAPYTLTKADQAAGAVHNVALASGTDPLGEKVTDEGTKDVPVQTPPVKPAPQPVLQAPVVPAKPAPVVPAKVTPAMARTGANA